jgi:CBS domain-containing protein
MNAKEIMTRDVATVTPDASVHEAARRMTEKRVSGVPVVAADGHLVGMLTASDLLHRVETGTEKQRSWFAKFIANPDQMARQYTKSHGLMVHEVMSRHVVSVREDANLSEVAEVLDSNRLKRVPVVKEGAVVGIISRGDLVRALSQVSVGKPVEKSDDATLQRNIIEQIRNQQWLDSAFLNITVKDGVVETWGVIPSADQRRALQVLIEEFAGVTKIEDHLKVGRPHMSGGWV